MSNPNESPSTSSAEKKEEKQDNNLMSETLMSQGQQSEQAGHTPGEWEVVPDSTCSGAWLTVCADGHMEREICRTDTFAVNETRKAKTYEESPHLFVETVDADEIRANARLIAAAPDLLAACEFVLQYESDRIGSVTIGVIKSAIYNAIYGKPVSSGDAEPVASELQEKGTNERIRN